MDFNLDTDEYWTKTMILSKLSQEEIFERYLWIKIRYRKQYVNPMRDDKTETASFYWKGDKLYFHDFYAGFFDCFDVAMWSNGKTFAKNGFSDTLQIIAEDFNLKEKSKQIILKIEPVKIEPTQLLIKRLKHFTKAQLKFWNDHAYVTEEELIEAKIYPLDKLWFKRTGSDKLIYSYSDDDIGFAYHLASGFNYQCYFPFRKKGQMRFAQNTNEILHFFNSLKGGDFCVVTKSRKDAFFMRKFGLNDTFALMHEGQTLTKEQLKHIDSMYPLKFSLMDNDTAGKKASLKLKQQGFIPLLFPKDEPKDFSDNLKLYKQHSMLDLINDLKQQFL